MAIEAAFLISLIFGFVFGIKIGNPKLGCAALLIVPITIMVHIQIWQSQNPEVIRSTSGLDVVFGSFWPSVGALVGIAVGLTLKILDSDKQESSANLEQHYGDLDYAKASVSRACSDREIPFLVSVSGYFKDNKIWLYFLTDRAVTKDEREELQCVSTEIISDYYQLGLEEFFVTELPKFDDDYFEVNKNEFQPVFKKRSL